MSTAQPKLGDQAAKAALATGILVNKRAKDFIYRVQCILINSGKVVSPVDMAKAVRCNRLFLNTPSCSPWLFHSYR